jgi:hypothetical protein
MLLFSKEFLLVYSSLIESVVDCFVILPLERGFLFASTAAKSIELFIAMGLPYGKKGLKIHLIRFVLFPTLATLRQELIMLDLMLPFVSLAACLPLA